MNLNNPTAYWPLNSSGADLSGNGHTIAFTNVTFVPGIKNNAVSFSANQTGSISSISGMGHGTSDFTYSFWLNNSSSVPNRYYTIIDQGFDSSLGLLIEYNNTLQKLFIYANGGLAGSFDTDIGVSVWNNWIIERSSGVITLYKNLVSQGSFSLPQNLGITSPVYFSQYSGGENMDALLEQFYIYPYALSSDDRKRLYALQTYPFNLSPSNFFPFFR